MCEKGDSVEQQRSRLMPEEFRVNVSTSIAEADPQEPLSSMRKSSMPACAACPKCVATVAVAATMACVLAAFAVSTAAGGSTATTDRLAATAGRTAADVATSVPLFASISLRVDPDRQTCRGPTGLCWEGNALVPKERHAWRMSVSPWRPVADGVLRSSGQVESAFRLANNGSSVEIRQAGSYLMGGRLLVQVANETAGLKVDCGLRVNGTVSLQSRVVTWDKPGVCSVSGVLVLGPGDLLDLQAERVDTKGSGWGFLKLYALSAELTGLQISLLATWD